MIFTLIESLKFFDKDLIRATGSRSFKSSTVLVCGVSGSHVPRESVYDAELMRIFCCWLRPLHGWNVTGQWHLRTALGQHKYTDMILQQDKSPPIVLELLATGDPSSVKSHIAKTSENNRLLSANEGWVIHFTCEDDYGPIWQSDEELNNGVNIMHISHDLDFEQLRVWACWKDDDGIRKYHNCNLDL